METIPKDPFILLSFINMKLRDEFSSFDDLILAYDLDKTEIIDKMGNINYIYDKTSNQFKQSI